MSERSYRRNVALGVTGPNKPTCFLSGAERVSPGHQVSPTLYRAQCRMWPKWERSDSRDRRDLELDMFDRIAYELGGFAVDDFIFERIDRSEYRLFSSTIRKLVKKEYRILIDVGMKVGESSKRNGDCHTLALKVFDEGEAFKLVSNHTQKELQGYLSLRDICNVINEPKDPYRVSFPYNDSNVAALPAA